MAKKKEPSGDLVIVESPAKAKTIEKYLGDGFTVLSSYGHIRDLPERDLSVDVANGFEPTYVIPDEKQARLNELKKVADRSNTVWLATDEDREGEAISWHLKEALELPDGKVKRITFNEITKSAILEAIEHPRAIDLHLVDAQQARRVLDRLVGYELSPILWRKVKPNLSAGRVQSVAVRIIVEREREILNFESRSAFRVAAVLTTAEGATVKAELPARFATEQEARTFLEGCIGATYTVNAVEKKPGRRSPAPPFTTSTLQQEASRKLGYSVTRTMQIAQGLYEDGKITYMRTDSVNLSEQAIAAAQRAIGEMYGERYGKPRRFATKSKGAQEAHEAIRPTDLFAKNISDDRDSERLYDLIWKRTLASQMAEAELEKTIVNIAISGHNDQQLVAHGEVILFDGFLKVYLEGRDDDDEEEEGLLPDMKQGDALQLQEMNATQRFERPAARYTEASLVKKLEEQGIGRPSTYAPTIGTVQKRGYVVKENREGTPRPYRILTLKEDVISEQTASENVGAEKQKLFPTDIGMVVNDFLVEQFPVVVDLQFTANVEEEFDVIAEGKEDWREMIARFYQPFHAITEKFVEDKEKVMRHLGNDPASGKPVYARIGRFGPMIQIGEVEDEEKPRFASLHKGQSIQTITFEEALALFTLPRDLGEHEGEMIIVGVGRYGPYVKRGESYASLEAEDDPYSIELPRAIELFQKKAGSELGEYEGEKVTVGKGRFGPYVKYGKKYVNIPRGEDPASLDLQRAVELIEKKKAGDKARELGEYEGEMLSTGRGRFGPFIKFGKSYVSIPRDEDVTAVTLERAVELIKAKKAEDAARMIQVFEGSPVQVLKGRYGPYITDGKKNANIPKDKEPASLTLEECVALLGDAPAKKKAGRKGGFRKKK